MASFQDLQKKQELETIKHLTRKGKMESWMGLVGGKLLQSAADRQDKMLASEDASVRNALGMPEPNKDGGDPMSNTILGDIQYPTPIVVNGNNSSSGLGLVAAAVIGAMIPGSAVLGAAAHYFLSSKPEAVQRDTDTDTSVDIGLGRISDLTPPE